MKEGLVMTLDVTKDDKINTYYKGKIIDYLISSPNVEGNIALMQEYGIYEVIEQQAMLDATGYYIFQKQQNPSITQNQKANLLSLLHYFWNFSKDIPDSDLQNWKTQIENYLGPLNCLKTIDEELYNLKETEKRFRKIFSITAACMDTFMISCLKLCDVYLLYHLSDAISFLDFYRTLLPNSLGEEDVLTSVLEFKASCPEILKDGDVQDRLKKIVEFNQRAKKGKGLPFTYSQEKQKDARNILVRYLNYEVKKELNRSRKKD